MDKDIPLDVVYERVLDKKEDSECRVDLEDNTPTPSSQNNEEKKCKKRRRRFCVNFCACLGVFSSVYALVYLVIVLSISVRLYMNFNQCFHSKENFYKENIFSLKNIKQIHFDVVTGFVNVGFHEKDTINIRVWENARSRSVVDPKSFESIVTINGSVINVHSVSPAFSFKTCQHAAVEIFLPSSSKNKEPISISGSVKMGWIQIEGESGKSFGNLDISVDLGKIDIDNVVASQLSLSAEVGAIEVSDSIVSVGTKLQSHTGVIRTHDLYTHNIHSYNLFGCSKHYDLYANVIKVDTKFGLSSVHKASSLGKVLDLSLNTEYGNSLVVLEESDINFKLGTTRGHMVVEYEETDWKCKLEKFSFTSLNGKCSPRKVENTKENKKSEVKIDMNTKYGSSTLLVDRIDIDE